LIQKDADWQKWKAECIRVSDELCSLKKLSPEAEPLLADFKPFEDIPSTATAAVAPLLVCVFSYLRSNYRNALGKVGISVAVF